MKLDTFDKQQIRSALLLLLNENLKALDKAIALRASDNDKAILQQQIDDVNTTLDKFPS